jgi:hypothetical protein
MQLGLFAKAIYATVVAGLGSLAAVMVDDTGFGDVTDGQWVVVVGAALLAGGGVYGITNKTA